MRMAMREEKKKAIEEAEEGERGGNCRKDVQVDSRVMV